MTLLWVGLAAFFAGLVDAMVGGGGLIQLPSLLLLYPDHPVAVLMGSNKIASIAGTSLAFFRYMRRVPVDWRGVAPTAATAFAGSLLGAWTVTQVPSGFMRPLALLLLILVATYTFWNKNLGVEGTFKSGLSLSLGVILGSTIGFYDGFFGPGTGSFLVFAFVSLGGMNFLGASAAAKLVNVSTNLAALAIFLPAGDVDWRLGVVMAACNMTGAFLGTRIALRHGARLVRGLFMLVVLGFVAKLGWDLWNR